jgi:hypothetical protein
LFIFETMSDRFDQVLQVRQDSASHHDGDLLDDLDTGVTSLPGLLRSTDGFEEGEEGRNTEGGSDDRESTSGSVTNVLVGVIDIWRNSTLE